MEFPSMGKSGSNQDDRIAYFLREVKRWFSRGNARKSSFLLRVSAFKEYLVEMSQRKATVSVTFLFKIINPHNYSIIIRPDAS